MESANHRPIQGEEVVFRAMIGEADVKTAAVSHAMPVPGRSGRKA